MTSQPNAINLRPHAHLTDAELRAELATLHTRLAECEAAAALRAGRDIGAERTAARAESEGLGDLPDALELAGPIVAARAPCPRCSPIAASCSRGR